MGSQNKKLVSLSEMHTSYVDDLADRMQISAPELIRRIVERYISRYSQEEGMAHGIEVSINREYKGNMLPMTMYSHNNQVYVEGVDGQRYAISVANRTAEKIEVVLSVDGLDICDGEDASVEKRGFVIPAFSNHTFSGFRLNDEDVATFRFGSQETGYASKIGKPRNIGVIGVAVFKEKRISRNILHDTYLGSGGQYGTMRSRSMSGSSDRMYSLSDSGPSRTKSKGVSLGLSTSCVLPNTAEVEEPTAGGITLDCGVAGSADSSRTPVSEVDFFPNPEIRERNLSTQFGEKRQEKVGHTTFTRLTTEPWQVFSLRYDSRENLEALGITIIDQMLHQRETANPFPASSQGCTPPDGWSGY